MMWLLNRSPERYCVPIRRDRFGDLFDGCRAGHGRTPLVSPTPPSSPPCLSLGDARGDRGRLFHTDRGSAGGLCDRPLAPQPKRRPVGRSGEHASLAQLAGTFAERLFGAVGGAPSNLGNPVAQLGKCASPSRDLGRFAGWGNGPDAPSARGRKAGEIARVRPGETAQRAERVSGSGVWDGQSVRCGGGTLADRSLWTHAGEQKSHAVSATAGGVPSHLGGSAPVEAGAPGRWGPGELALFGDLGGGGACGPDRNVEYRGLLSCVRSSQAGHGSHLGRIFSEGQSRICTAQNRAQGNGGRRRNGH